MSLVGHTYLYSHFLPFEILHYPLNLIIIYHIYYYVVSELFLYVKTLCRLRASQTIYFAMYYHEVFVNWIVWNIILHFFSISYPLIFKNSSIRFVKYFFLKNNNNIFSNLLSLFFLKKNFLPVLDIQIPFPHPRLWI